jgi:hypothetical protein
MSVHRLAQLPEAESRGRLIVPAAVAELTGSALRASRGPDGPHEGLVFWVGRRCDRDTLVLAAIVPDSDHGPRHVFVGEAEVGRTGPRARSLGLALVAQVHSHPGTDTRHSDGDDRLIVMPHEGMFSVVVAGYGRGELAPRGGAGLHQYQDGRWVRIPAGHEDALVIVAPLIESLP